MWWWVPCPASALLASRVASSRVGDPWVSDGTHRLHMVERECSTVRGTNSYSRSNEDSLTAASCLEPQRTRRDINRDQSESDGLRRVGGRSNRKQRERTRRHREDRFHQNLPEERRCRKRLHGLHCCPSDCVRGCRVSDTRSFSQECDTAVEGAVNSQCHKSQ